MFSQNLPLKKITLVTVFILAVVMIAWFIYALFFKPAPALPPEGETPGKISPETGGLPPTESGDLERPVVEPVTPGELPSAIARGGVTETTLAVNSWISNIAPTGRNNLAYYDNIKNQFFTLDANGNIITLSDTKFPDVKSVAWSPQSNKAVIEFPDGANVFYDFETEKQVTLPSHWTEFKFAPDQNKIIFKSLGLEPENNFLLTADENGGNPQIVSFLGENAQTVILDWSPNKQIVGTYAKPLDAGRSTVNFIGLNNENFKQLVVNGYNYNGKWNDDGTQLLYQVSSDATNNNPSLWIVNAQGNAIGTGRRPLNIQTTVDKCVFSDNDTIYCAVPRFLPAGSGIIPSQAAGIADDIYKINVITSSSGIIAELENPVPITSLTLSPDKRYLYFIDGPTNSLRKIRLQ